MAAMFVNKRGGRPMTPVTETCLVRSSMALVSKS